ncbi:MAG: hypothetical protein WDW36_000565 [Sanguina aurantia]
MRSVLAEVQLNRGGDLLPRPATVAKPTRQGVAHAGTEGGARGKENRRVPATPSTAPPTATTAQQQGTPQAPPSSTTPHHQRRKRCASMPPTPATATAATAPLLGSMPLSLSQQQSQQQQQQGVGVRPSASHGSSPAVSPMGKRVRRPTQRSQAEDCSEAGTLAAHHPLESPAHATRSVATPHTTTRASAPARPRAPPSSAKHRTPHSTGHHRQTENGGGGGGGGGAGGRGGFAGEALGSQDSDSEMKSAPEMEAIQALWDLHKS